MFQGFNTTDATNTLSLLSGFLTIFSGVYLLNLSRKDPVGDTLLGSGAAGRHGGFEEEAIPTDSLTAFAARISLQNRRSSAEGAHTGSTRHSRQHSWGSSVGGNGRRSIGDREALMHDYALHDLAETSEDEPDGTLSGPDSKKKSKKTRQREKLIDEESGMQSPNGQAPDSRSPYNQHHQNAMGSAPRLSGSGRMRDGSGQQQQQQQKPSK
jgi:hypothetical protein